MKRILVPMLGDAGDRPALDMAAAVARRHGAHIDAVLFRRDPRDMIPLVGEGFNAGMIETLVQTGETEAAEREKVARATYAEWQGAVGVSNGAEGGRPSASFSTVTGPLPGGVARPARAADLTVFARADPEDGQERPGMIEAAVLEAGRPILLAGRGGAGDVGRKAMIAWNGSVEAARAVAMAMPILATAESVSVVVVDDGGTHEAPDDLVHTLKLWGIAASGRTVKVGSEGIAATLEAEAVAGGVDMILLGAYSHSRLREFILGGVTDDALTDSSIAMLLAH